MKISVVINTYNAEKYLRQVLESVRQFDEVVICDMESTDSTVAIAEEYGCLVVVFPKENHTIPEPARNFAIQSASSEYVLVVDADEEVPAALREYLYDLVAQPDCPAGVYLPRKNYFLGHYMHCYYPDYILRFFRRDAADWPPTIHSLPRVEGKTIYIPRKRKDLALIHLVNESIHELWDKMNRYTDNDAYRRRHKKYGTLALFYRPRVRFFKMFILKGGFRAGRAGYMKAKMDAAYQFMITSKIIEQREKEAKGR